MRHFHSQVPSIVSSPRSFDVRLVSVSERVLLTLWVGGMWITGYLVAPVLFNMLDDRRLAGAAAGALFSAISYIGLVAGALLLLIALYTASRRWYASWRIWGLVAMMLLIVVGEFGLRPEMTVLRDAGLVEGTEVAARFARLHGLSSVLFLFNSLMGLVLVVFGVVPRDEA